MSRVWVLVLCSALAACGKTTPPPPGVPSTGDEQITGRESIGWDQRAADAVELATFRYAMYVDGTRSELTGVSCATSATEVGFVCTARLPSLSPGRHALRIAAFIVDGSVFESAKSGTLNVSVTAASTTSPTGSAGAGARLAWPAEPIATSDGLEFRVELVARDMDRPSGLASMPDGSLLTAQHDGSLRVVGAGGDVSRASAIDDADEDVGGLLAVALDPQFARNHFAYVAYAARSREGAPVVRVARLREAAGTFADRIVLREATEEATAAAALTFGADGKLYVAMADEILRLNPDGTTPDDQAGFTPIYASGYRGARGLSWQSPSGLLWVLDSFDATTARLSAARLPATSRALPRSTVPSSMAFSRGELFVGSDEGRHLLRIRFDPRDATTIVATERLLQDAVGGIRVVAAGPGDALYFATADAIGRLVTVSRK